MDDRKKRIDDLVKNNRESQASLDTLLDSFGESLYIRIKDIDKDSDEVIQYSAYLQEIAEANASIAKIEEKNRRFKELEDAIAVEEQEEKERAKEMAVFYRRLGKALLLNSRYDDFTSLYKDQADALTAKLNSLETRITDLEIKEGKNVFSWIGKSAQGLVLKSFLSKAQESQDQLYHTIGSQFVGRGDSVSEDSEVAAIIQEIQALREAATAAQKDLELLKDEKRMILASFGIDGNPQKQIQTVKNNIAEINEKLHTLYKKFGSQVCGIDEDIAPERKYFIDSIVTAEDGEIIGRAARLNQSITENTAAIEKLKASLAIDEEKTKIDRFQRSILDKKQRIADLEKDIEELEFNVKVSEDKVQQLESQI